MVDGVLPSSEAKEIHRHIKDCLDCAGEYRLLSLVAQSVADLPLYQPGPAFNVNILSALGLQPAAKAIPVWLKWAIGSFVGLGTAWAAVVILFCSSKISGLNAFTTLKYAGHYKELTSYLGLRLVQAGFYLANFVSLLSKSFVLMMKSPGLPLQIAAACLVAMGLISILSKNIDPHMLSKNERSA